MRAVSQLSSAVQVLGAAIARAKSADVPESLSWVRSFDTEDLAAMGADIVAVIQRAAAGDADWDEVDALIHEWRESGLAIIHGVLNAAISEPESLEQLADPSAATLDQISDEDVCTP